MARLTLTDEEEKLKEFVEWDEQLLGQLVVKLSSELHVGNKKATEIVSMAQMLCLDAAEMNAKKLEFVIDGLRYEGAAHGDWHVSIVWTGDSPHAACASEKQKITELSITVADGPVAPAEQLPGWLRRIRDAFSVLSGRAIALHTERSPRPTRKEGDDQEEEAFFSSVTPWRKRQ